MKPTTSEEREGILQLHAAVVKAFENAKKRGSKDPIYHKMMLPSNRFCIWATIKRLRDHDPDFHPSWFEGSKYFKMKNGRTLEELVERVQADVDDFTWAW